MSDPVSARPAICLNMIVRNEAHIVREVLDSVAPYINSWVIVDTGSDDGTQDVIRDHMAGLGIPGELHERPWRNFGHNRSEALALAQGRGDFIWVIDADDTVVGTPDFTGLDADIYRMRRKLGSTIYWRPELFRDGIDVRWVGATHECATWEGPCADTHLEGEYHIEDRQLSSRNLSGQKFAHDRDLLLPEVQRNPEDARSVFYLAQSYYDLRDFENAHKWYARRAEMGGWDQEVFCSMLRVAETMSELGAAWPEVADAYLRAWEFRPTRAEPLFAIARYCRNEGRYQLGYLMAKRAAEIPIPEQDLFVRTGAYGWHAIDEQAVCAFWIGQHDEAFALCRNLLARTDIPDDDRQRITRNRDFSVPARIEAASSYPDVLIASLVTGQRDAEVTVSLIAGPDPAVTEQTLNSFLHCCTDIARVGRFLVLDAGLSAEDRENLLRRYGFLEFVNVDPGAQLAQIREQIHGRFWLHLDQGWQFFASENFVTRLTAVLDAEPNVFQVGINFADAVKLTGATATEETVRRAPDAGRYVLSDVVARGPAMFDTARFDRAGAAELQTASLDEVLCIEKVQQPPQETTPYSSAWYDGQVAGSVSSAAVVVPMLAALTRPGSVLDVGCGVGGWVAMWREIGADAIGVDGDYVQRDQLRIPADRFIGHDLTTPLDLGRRFDLVTCLEVAEHLPAEAAETIVDSLCRHADVIAFAAAIPGQGGTGHVNERWASFWAALFATHGYRPYDLLRSRLWCDERCEWWYRQNVLIYTTAGVAREHGWPEMTTPLDIVHPELFTLRS